MAVRLKHIAEQAGVTVSTVSRALGKGDRVSAELRKKIIRIAEEQGYRRKRTTSTVAYVIDRRLLVLTSHFYNRVIEGIRKRLGEDAYTLQFDPMDIDKLAPGSINLKNLAGMIFTSAAPTDYVVEARNAGLPVVLLDDYLPSEYIDSVLIDNLDGVLVGMRYLHSLGHSRIAYLAGEPEPAKSAGPVFQAGYLERLAGYRRAVGELGLDTDPELVIPCSFSIQSGYEAMKEYLGAAKVRPTAVMAVNDIVAIGAMEAAKAMKIAIPGEISILGFDDIELASDIVPRLSTMHVDKEAMGRMAADRLLQIVSGADAGFLKAMVRPRLIVRESTGGRSDQRPSASAR